MVNQKVCKKKYFSWVFGANRKICHSGSLFGIIRHHSASLVMPISDPRDRFFYPHHTPMKDTYYIALRKARTAYNFGSSECNLLKVHHHFYAIFSQRESTFVTSFLQSLPKWGLLLRKIIFSERRQFIFYELTLKKGTIAPRGAISFFFMS